MMRVVFLGVGEAFDEDFLNTSILIRSKTVLLLDCGYAIPTQLWRHCADPELLDAVYLSHFHADHYFGLPILLLKLWEQRRTKPLKIIAQHGARERLETLTTMAYPNLRRKLNFEIEYLEAADRLRLDLNELSLEFADSAHSLANLAVKIESGNRKVCYSGDGMFTPGTMLLYEGADVLIHESHTLEPDHPGHANLPDVVAMALRLGVRTLALTHLQREVRRQIQLLRPHLGQKDGLTVLLPALMDSIDLE